MSFTAAEMLQYLNYAALGVIGLAMFWGFIQGFYKSTFFFIWTVGILVAGFFVIPTIASMVMTVDISSYASQIPFTIEGLTVTTVQDTIISFLVNMQPNLANVLVEGSDALALVLGVVQMAVSLVLFIVLFILNATVFKFVGWIIWMIIKPRRRGADGRRKKKTFISRLLGAGVGGLRGAFSILLISIPFAALVSLSSGLDLATTVSVEPQYQLMVVDDELVLVEVQQPMAETDELIEEVKLFLKDYRTTYVGMIAGYVKIGDSELDEYVFDSIFSVKVKSDNLDTQIKFRAELEKALDAVNLLIEANGGSTTFGDDFIYSLDPETATEVFDLITNLDIIEVVIPIGLEYLVNSGDFDEMLEGYEDLFDLEDLKAIDYMSDLGILGDVFVNALSLVQDQGVPIDQLNYFLFDGETVTDIFTSLGELDLIEYGLPIGFNYVLQMASVQQVFTDLGVTQDDLTLPTGEELQADFANIANVYTAVQGMGFDSMDDFETLTDPAVMASIPDQAIADLFDAVFGFSIIENNSAIASQYIYNMLTESLPADFQGLITLEDISGNFNATEITNLILLAKVVVSTGILDLMDETLDPDYSVILSDENIASIVSRISESNLITSKMNDVIAQLLAGLNLGVTLEIPSSINWAEQSGQTELTALLKGAREILASGIISGDLSVLDDTMADNLSLYISDSLVIRYNLNAIFEMALSGQEGLSDYEIALPESYEEWTQVEINSLLKAAIILSTAGSDPNALINLTEAQIATIAKSKVIANTFRNVFVTMVDVGGDLEGLLFVPDGLTWYSTDTETGELEYLLLALQTIVPEGGDVNNLNVDINTLMDADVDVLLQSKVIEMTLVETIVPMIETGDLSAYISLTLPNGDDYSWYQDEDPSYPEGDLKPLLLAIQGLSDLGIEFTSLDYNAITTALSDEQAITDLNDLLLSSRVLHSSLDKLFTEVLSTSGLNITLDHSAEPTFWQGTETEEGELIKLLRAVSVVGSSDFDANAFLTLSNDDIHTVAQSKIIANAFESVIVDMAAPGGDLDGQIFIPTGLVWYSTDTETGELENLLVALKVLVPGGDIATASFDLDTIITADIDILLASKVIEHTAVETIKPMIESGDLADYIEPKLPGDIDYVWYQDVDPLNPEGDLRPLLLAIQDLDALGISLTTFDYNAFNAALTDEVSIQNVNDIMLSSRIIHNSLDKMFSFVLNTSAGFNVTLDNSDEPTFWQGTETEDGELIKLLRAVKVIGSNNLDANTITSQLLTDLLDTGSVIVRVQISNAVKDAVTDIPAGALDVNGDITETELRAIATALSNFTSVNELSSIDANTVDSQMLTDLLDAGSLIVNRQMSSAIKGAITDIPAAALDAEGDITVTEMRAIAAALSNFASVNELSSIDANSITSALLTSLLDAESLIVNRQISIAVKGAITDIPAAALDADNHIKETELRAIATALSNFSSVSAMSTIDTSTVDSDMLNDLLDANSLIVNRQMSTAIKGAITDIPNDALEVNGDIKVSEMRAIATALSNFNSVNDMANIDASTITSALLTNLLDAESLIVNRQISIAVKGAITDIPAGALDADNHITVTELRAVAVALDNFTSVNDMANIDANSITSTLLTDLLDAESLIVNRQISIAVKGAITDMPATALDADNHVKETELRALATALANFTSVSDMANITANDIDSTFLTNLLTANSLIVNRQISSAIINSGLSIPAAALASAEDITTTELNALAVALVHIPGGVAGISSIDANAIDSTLLNNLLDAESLIVNRQISTAIINSTLDVPSTALETVNDIYVTELRALADALVYVGSVSEVADINAAAIDSTLLTNLLSANSIIVNRQISSAIIASGLAIPSDAYATVDDITMTELTALADALQYISGGVAGISNLTANTITGSMITNLLGANSVIVNRQISSAIISSGLTTGNTDAIDNSVGPRNGEVKNIEMVGLAEALTAMGPTTTVADLTSISAATVAALDDATIDVMFDPDYTIIYYILEDEMSSNALYTMTLAPSDYEGGNPANRILRSKLAADLKSGAYM